MDNATKLILNNYEKVNKKNQKKYNIGFLP